MDDTTRARAALTDRVLDFSKWLPSREDALRAAGLSPEAMEELEKNRLAIEENRRTMAMIDEALE